jgi:hypothetical protein
VTVEGDEGIYTQPPDMRAGQYLIDRILGKPTERIQHELDRMSDDELLSAAAALLAIVGPEAGGDQTPGSGSPGG